MSHLITRAILGLSFIGFCSSVSTANDDDDKLKSKVIAPPNTVAIGSVLGGSYFVDKDLVKRSKALKSQLRSIRKQIRNGG